MKEAQLVNPYIGNISHLLRPTQPEVFLPHSPAKSFPLYKPGGPDAYNCEEVVGFPIGLISILPTDSLPAEEKPLIRDHGLEQTHPYGSVMEFDGCSVKVETTVTRHGYAFRFYGTRAVFINAKGEHADISVDGQTIRVYSSGQARFRQLPNEFAVIRARQPFEAFMQEDEQIILTFTGQPVELYAAVSYISFEKAEEIFEKELAGKSFELLLDEAREIWDRQLSRIKVSGGTPDRQAAFYTALYRSFQRMVDYSEYGKYYSGYDNRIHDGEFFYCNDNTWDTFRSMHPLQLLLEPSRQKKILESYLLMYRQSGLMPSVPGVNGDLPVMIGFHAAAIFADAMAKGIELDYETAYEGIYKNATEQSMLPWRCNLGLTELDRHYLEKGYVPALKMGEKEWVEEVHPFERRQSVAVTLEHAYDDWCAAQLAKRLGKNDDYEMFMRRSKNYRNLFNAETGFMAPKDSDGGWIEDFDPKYCGGQGGRDYYAENNAWIYTWSVFHDVDGLIRLFGTKEAMCSRLDRLFTEGYDRAASGGSKHGFLAQFPDATGLFGQFCMGNEPSFHIPYLYDYCGAPWKTQKRLRDLMNVWFTNTPLGICGDEDGGAMSSWFVFSAMGFYPVCPGRNEYALGTPIFDKIEIALENGRHFTILAEGAGGGQNYIQSAKLNGKTWDNPWISYEDIHNGGTLTLQMGRKPNMAWGAESRFPE